MNNPSQYITDCIIRGQKKHSQPKPTWNQYVKNNYSNVAKIPNQHPMTTLSNQYKNLQK